MIPFSESIGHWSAGGGFQLPSFIGWNSKSRTIAGGTDDLSLTGTNAAAGDFCLAIYAVASTADFSLNSLVSSAGGGSWTKDQELYANDTNDINLAVFYKFLDAADISGNYVRFSDAGNVGNGSCRGVGIYRNVNASNPLDVASTTATGIDTTTINPPSITPITPNSLIVGVGAEADTLGRTIDATGSLTSRGTHTSTDGDKSCSIGMADLAQLIPGALDPSAWTISGTSTSDSWAAITMALRGKEV